ncbi:hypothetical protein BKE38_08660 [Pseudoroseomonas deserti]|uniref:Uncharacterized protein n=1 Tax=Teichococcus deserti TaxID=1817963 RepID=A0A1V2H630_9PROT|nr:hypothetical protein [Pseudoroseomonas deserti]ONG55728.1 hypothetical protein BKE38_08660 [Pseudoroseomonas deserti]
MKAVALALALACSLAAQPSQAAPTTLDTSKPVYTSGLVFICPNRADLVRVTTLIAQDRDVPDIYNRKCATLVGVEGMQVTVMEYLPRIGPVPIVSGHLLMPNGGISGLVHIPAWMLKN